MRPLCSTSSLVVRSLSRTLIGSCALTRHLYRWSRCVKSMMELTPASRNRRNCHRITCVSDDDRIEAPMMLPVAKAVKWVAAQVTSKLQNGTEKTTVCMRGEKGQQKQVPGTERGVIECPDVDIVCHGRPCRNGGIPKYGV